MIQRFAIDQDNDREGWLALRKPDVTASVVGALFGASPHTTIAELYWQKKGVELPRNYSEEMMEWREDLEAVFPKRVRRMRPGWRLEKAAVYLRDPVAKIGATPDFWVHGDARGRGVLQAKTSDRRTFEREWSDGRPPFWIILQNAVELMLDPQAAFGAVAVITVESYKSQTEIFDIPRNAAVEKKIRDAVEQFWIDFEFNIVPQVDPKRDASLLAAMYSEEKPFKRIDLSGDNELPGLLAERATLKGEIKSRQERCEEINQTLIEKLRDAEGASIGEFSATYKRAWMKAKLAKLEGWGSRKLTITDRREKEINPDGKRPY